MADEALKQKIHDILKEHYFSEPNDMVDVSDGDDEACIHVVVVSRKFDGRRMSEKNDLIWNVLMNHLQQEEWNKISLTVGASPQAIKAGVF
jgi:acid stress-induced BolA-like protein IbaG/YrbA